MEKGTLEGLETDDNEKCRKHAKFLWQPFLRQVG